MIARKEEFHSFRIHEDGTVTWTIRHEKPMPGKPKPNGGEGGDFRERESSKRALRSRARVAAHNELDEKARRLRAVFFIRRWARASTTPPPELQQPSLAMQQSPPGAAPPSAKRACSATATPVKATTESSEEAGGVGRPQGCAARVQVGAQRTRMYSPSGGPAAGQLHGPPRDADGRAPQSAPRNAGQPTRLAYATTAHERACSVPNTSYQSMPASGQPSHVECAAAQMQPEQMIAHMRAHEYPHFMRHHAQQGVSAQEAHAMYMQYEQYRIRSA